jgi:homoserine O-acetyltransferase
MGGMQALQWAVSHAGFMARIVAMTPMAKTAPWAALVTATARACLQADPAWTGNGFTARPERGWRAYAGLMSALLMRTPQAVAALGDVDAVTRWLDGLIAQQEAVGFDAHDYLYQSWAYEQHDVGATPGFGGDTRAALAAITAQALLLAPPLDLFNPATEARSAAAAIPGARFVEIPSLHGHLAATSLVRADAEFLNREIAAFIG